MERPNYGKLEDDDLISKEDKASLKKAQKEQLKQEKALAAQLKKQEQLEKTAKSKQLKQEIALEKQKDKETAAAQKKVAIQAIKTKSSNVINCDVAVYMNVGSWTGGQAIFGLVAGGDVALCNWFPKVPSMLRIKGDMV